jgi:competence protein ComEA
MSQTPHPPHWLLRRADQAAVAGLVVGALLAVVGWRAAQPGARNTWIEWGHAAPLSARFTVDPNTAELTELMQLPGIGEALGSRIIRSRQTVGPFRTPEDVGRIRGIGPKKLEQLRPHIEIAPAAPNHSSGK